MGRRKARSGRKPREGRAVDVDAVIARERDARSRCAAKRRFDSESEARTFALYHRSQWSDDPVPYQCEFCRGWHFASRRPPAGR
jgi:hypothetical protein